MKNTFFMVYLHDSHGGPSYKHSTKESAIEEAKRLSRLHKKKAYVLVAFKSFELIEFKEETLINSDDSENDLPF